jgi:hypothetical protein
VTAHAVDSIEMNWSLPWSNPISKQGWNGLFREATN